MTLFGRRRDSDVLQVSTWVRQELRAQGIASQLEPGDDVETATIVLATGEHWPLWNLVQGLRENVDRADWPDAARRHVRTMLVAQQEPVAESLSPDELRTRLRSRLFSDTTDNDALIDLSYGLPFSPGIIEVLSIDVPQAVSTLGRDQAEALPWSFAEALAIGRENTLAREPIDEQFDVIPLVHGLGGNSLFIASKVASMGALVADGPIGPAPMGVAFAVPNRSTLLYAVLTPENWPAQINELARLLASITTDPDFFHPAGVINADVHYWAPDGRTEFLGGRRTDTEGESVDQIVLGEAFIHHVLGDLLE